MVNPKISFKQPLFFNDHLSARWADRHRIVKSATELEVFYHRLVADPRTKRLEMADKAHFQEAMTFYNDVVKDGRFIYDLRQKPDFVAKQLGLTVSDDALKLVSEAANLTGVKSDNDVTIVMAIVIVAIYMKPQESELVIDTSQTIELKL